jgi:hypothetical protein
MRRNKNLVNMIKHVSEYSNERKYKANIELDQFMYDANKHNKNLLRVKSNKKIKLDPIKPIKNHDEKYSSLIGFLESKPRIRRNMKLIVSGILILIIGAGAYAALNISKNGIEGSHTGHSSVREYLQAYEDMRPDEKDMEERMMILDKSGDSIFTISKGPKPFRTIGKFNSEDGEDTILLINIDKETKNDDGGLNIDQRKVGILMHKDNDGNITFKMAEVAPSIPILFNYKQQAVSISPGDYKTTLKSNDVAGDHKPLIKAALYSAHKLNLIDIDETYFGII